MKKHPIIWYDEKANENKDFIVEVYTRNELISYIKGAKDKFNDYSLEIYAPSPIECTIKAIKKLDKSCKFFIMENEKTIYLYNT